MIPTDWKLVKLKDTSLTIIDGDRGNNYPKSDEFTDDGYCLFLSAKNITKNGFRLDEKQFITEEKDNLLRKGKLKDLDIIITTRGSVGHISYNENIQYDNIRINSGMVLLRNNDNSINQKYIYKLFASNVIQRQIEKIAFGSAQPQLTVKEINNLKIPLPPLKEQEKIADILSTADDKIDAITSQIKKTETLKKGLLQKLLSEGIGHSEFKDSELGKIPLSWEVVELEKGCNRIIGGGTPSKTNDNYWNNGTILWATPTEFTKSNDRYISKTILKITQEGLDNSSATLLRQGTVIMSSRATIGECKINTIEMTTNQGFISYECNEILNNLFLLYLIGHYKDRIIKVSFGSTFLEVSRTTMRNFKIPFPPLEEQKQIADILSTADEKLEVLRAKKEKYETLKKGLLQKLLSGEVRVDNFI